MSIEILPESRARGRRGAVQSADGWWIPIYCANCGAPWGMVPARHITFAFALCDACHLQHGTPAHCFAEPDAVYWSRVQDALAEERGGALSELDLQRHADDPSSKIGKLLRERVKLVEESAE